MYTCGLWHLEALVHKHPYCLTIVRGTLLLHGLLITTPFFIIDPKCMILILEHLQLKPSGDGSAPSHKHFLPTHTTVCPAVSSCMWVPIPDGIPIISTPEQLEQPCCSYRDENASTIPYYEDPHYETVVGLAMETPFRGVGVYELDCLSQMYLASDSDTSTATNFSNLALYRCTFLFQPYQPSPPTTVTTVMPPTTTYTTYDGSNIIFHSNTAPTDATPVSAPA